MVDEAGHPQPYYRVVDVLTHEVISSSFGRGHVFGSAMVQPAEDSMNGTDTFWVRETQPTFLSRLPKRSFVKTGSGQNVRTAQKKKRMTQNVFGVTTDWQAWGVTNGYGPTINSFYSTDLQTWINGTAFEIKNSTTVKFEGMCNNAVTRCARNQCGRQLGNACTTTVLQN